jgi:hypothetical protein
MGQARPVLGTTFAMRAAVLSEPSTAPIMNNSQFRRLLVDTPKARDGDKAKSPAAATPRAVLGARKHSSIPMTPSVFS